MQITVLHRQMEACAASVSFFGLFKPKTPSRTAEEWRELVWDATAEPLRYRLRRSRRKTLGLTIDREGLRVSAPMRLSLRAIESVLLDKRDWIVEKCAQQAERYAQRPALVLAHDARIPYLGGTCRLDLVSAPARTRWREDEAGCVLSLSAKDAESPEAIRAALVRCWKARALALFQARLAVIEPQLARHPTALSVTSAMTRWGSCSANGRVRLSWRLLCFETDIVDYVLAHELAHLVHMNHSAAFWQEVERLCPDYQNQRARLKSFSMIDLGF